MVDVRHLAYDLAVKLNVKHGTKMAGKEWLGVFMKRNEHLSIRAPETTHISHAGWHRCPIFTNLLKQYFISGKYSA